MNHIKLFQNITKIRININIYKKFHEELEALKALMKKEIIKVKILK